MHDGLKHLFEETDGDNNPFHVTNCMTTRADGATPIPPYLGHSNPSTQSVAPNLTQKYASSCLIALYEATCNGGWRDGVVSQVVSSMHSYSAGFLREYSTRKTTGRWSTPPVLASS